VSGVRCQGDWCQGDGSVSRGRCQGDGSVDTLRKV